MSDMTPPQAGWYADPENAAGERWWNGSGWSDHKRDSTTGSVPAAPEVAAVPPVVAPAAAPGSPYAPVPYGAAMPRSTTDGLAVAGLILSAGGWIVLGVIASIAGIILSAFGLARARQAEAAGQPNSGRGIAMAGLVIGIIVLVLGLLFIVLYVVLLMSSGFAS